MKIKKIWALFTALTIALLCALPAFAKVAYNTDYIPEKTAVIGAPDYSLTLRGDGSFYLGGEEDSVAVIFGGQTKEAKVSFESSYYPVSTHRYTLEGFSVKLSHFVYPETSGKLYVYSRFEIENLSDVALAFPQVQGASPITEFPAQVKEKDGYTVDYITPVETGAAAKTAERPALSYDEALSQMKRFWDSYLSESLYISGISGKNEKAVNEYRRALIYSAIGAESHYASLALSSAEYSDTVLTAADDLYACALAIRERGEEKALVALSSYSAMKALADSIEFDGEELPFETLEENLDALLSLQSYAYILSVIESGAPDGTVTAYGDEAKEAKNRAKALGDAIASAVMSVEAQLSYSWEAALTDSDYLISLNGEESAAALCSWHVKSAVFGAAPSKQLYNLAKGALEYHSAAATPEEMILSLFSQRDDGTIIIGRGCPLSILSENKDIEVKNVPLLGGGEATLRINIDKKNVEVSLSGNITSPIQIEFPAFKNNIEYASQGFDSESGIVTIPAGISSASVRLEREPSALEKDRSAAAALEGAVARAYEKRESVVMATTVSESAFEKALKKAEKARTATRAEKIEAAKNLSDVTTKLSPMISGYVFSSSSEGESAGAITKSEVYQKFALPSDGTVKYLYIEGEYCDGISAAVYTLRGDLYTTDELCAETVGEAYEDGIRFELDFEAEGEEIYVLCIFCEGGDVNLSLENSDLYSAHTRELGETVVYTGATLVFDMEVVQADRSDLDTFYTACTEADVSKYTKESQKKLKSCLKEAEKSLCAPSVTEAENSRVYEKLKAAYDGLDTYASEDKIEETPIIGIVLIAVVVVLLCATLVSALFARKKMTSDN